MNRPEARPYHQPDCSALCAESERLIESNRSLLAQLERNLAALSGHR